MIPALFFCTTKCYVNFKVMGFWKKKYVNPTSFPFKQFNNETTESLFVAFVWYYLPLIDFRNIWNLLRCVSSLYSNCRHLHSLEIKLWRCFCWYSSYLTWQHFSVMQIYQVVFSKQWLCNCKMKSSVQRTRQN